MGRAAAGQLGACLLLVSVSGCLSHQSRNSIRRAWVDFNSLGQPTVTFEQTDHLPYHAERVGHFLWMYGKTPGHQNLYKVRRYQKDLLSGEAVASTEIMTGESPADTASPGTAEEPPRQNRGSATRLRVPPPPQPIESPADAPSPSVKSASPTTRPLLSPTPTAISPQQSRPNRSRPNRRPMVPASPQAVPSGRQRPTAQESAPSGWTAYRGRK